MLALTRTPGETIYINDDIVIHIVAVAGQAVRIAIDAPAIYSIKRGEIYETVRAEDCLADRVTIKTEDN
jgi:carbon storage regulator